MIDKLIELKKEFGIYGMAMLSAGTVFITAWYVKRIINLFTENNVKTIDISSR